MAFLVWSFLTSVDLCILHVDQTINCRQFMPRPGLKPATLGLKVQAANILTTELLVWDKISVLELT